MLAKKIAVLVVVVAALGVGLLARPWVERLLGPRAAGSVGEGGHGHAHGEGNEEAVCEKHFVPVAECAECIAVPVTLADLEALKCDHDVRLLDCGECRWEAGVVAVDPHLLVRAGAPGGLLVLSEAEVRVPSATLRMTGHITANQNRVAHIGPRVAGVVSRSLVEVGARVKKDDILVELDSIELREALLSFSKATILLELARKRLERETGLVERKISTQQDLLDAEERYEEAKIEHEVARRRLSLLGVEEPLSTEVVSEPDRRRPLLNVRSPLDGVVTDAHAIPGELVTPDKELLTVADLSDVWLWIDIYERDFSAVLEGKKRGTLEACVRTGAFHGRDFSGTVDYIADSVSEETRTVKARVTLTNAEGLLRPGMFVTCDILLPGAEPRLLIPRDALLRDEGVTFVFKELKPGLFVRQGILAGNSYEGDLEVVGGLCEGERVVTRGAFILKSEVLREKLGAG